jgi:hypothetical protein
MNCISIPISRKCMTSKNKLQAFFYHTSYHIPYHTSFDFDSGFAFISLFTAIIPFPFPSIASHRISYIVSVPYLSYHYFLVHGPEEDGLEQRAT